MTSNVTINELNSLPHHDGQVVLEAVRDDFSVQVRFDRGRYHAFGVSSAVTAQRSSRDWRLSVRRSSRHATWRRGCGVRGSNTTRFSLRAEKGGELWLILKTIWRNRKSRHAKKEGNAESLGRKLRMLTRSPGYVSSTRKRSPRGLATTIQRLSTQTRAWHGLITLVGKYTKQSTDRLMQPKRTTIRITFRTSRVNSSTL